MAKTEKPTDAKDAPTKYFEDQFDDETVLYVFRKHPIAMRKGLIIGLVFWLVGPIYTLVLSYIPGHFPTMNFFFASLGLSIALGLLILLPYWISWYFSLFIVTDQRFIQITQKGLFHRAVIDMPLNQIQMVNYEIGGFNQTLLGFGTIMMQTFMGDLVIHEIHRPAETQKRIAKILREYGGMPAQMYEFAGADAESTDS